MKKIVSILGVFAAVVLMAACSGTAKTNGNAQQNAINKQNDITAKLVAGQPAPNLQYSTDRNALIKRYNKTADPNFTQYIAVMTPYGQVLFTGAVKGKVTPLDSQLTPADGLYCKHFNGDTPDGCGVVQIAEPNGTWGTNGQGVFWFDPSGVMHESSMPYILADSPFTLTTPPLLTINAEAK